MEKKYGYGYVRVSTDKQEELSPESQRKLLEEYAVKNNITLLSIFFEIGVSGRTVRKRPEFQKMIASAKSSEHPVDVILVWKFSRFARNQEESIVYKSLLKKQHKVDVISVSEPLADTPFGSLIERIIEWMDEYYSIRLSGEVLRGMKENARRGVNQTRPPFGYKIKERGKPPVIIPAEAEIIRIIFQKYVYDHMSAYDIAQYLNNLGICTSQGKKFERRSVEYILQNPTYCGMVRWNRTDHSTHQIKNPSEWILTKGMQESVISKDLFDRAQQRMLSEHRFSGKRPASTYRHWLSGLLKCPACGRTMTASTLHRANGEPYSYFTCYGYSKGLCDSPHGISSLILEKEFLASVKELLDINDTEYEPSLSSSSQAAKQEFLWIQKLLQVNRQKKQRIFASYQTGTDTLEEYTAQKERLQKEQQALEHRLTELSPSCSPESAQNISGTRKKIHGIYDILISDSHSHIEKNEALRQIVDKIIYNREQDTLNIYYISPDEIL